MKSIPSPVISPTKLPYMSIFFSQYTHHQALPSFPTRRSSDLRFDVVAFQVVTVGPRVDELGEALNARADGHEDRKSTRLNSSHVEISYAVFCLKKKKKA